MSGEIVFKNGEDVVFSNIPGSEISSSKSVLKKKPSAKKVSRRKIIEFFERLAEIETDPNWKERFENMGRSRFPPKISWISSPPESELQGKIIYKFRQSFKEQEILKEDSDEANILLIKGFIRKNTNIGANNQQDIELVSIPKDQIDPVPWGKLPSREQVKRINEYIKDYSMRNGLNDDQKAQLLSMLILKSSMGVLFSHLDFDSEGNVENIRGIQYDSKNDFYFIDR